jgi:hypothetical protein
MEGDSRFPSSAIFPSLAEWAATAMLDDHRDFAE